MVMWAVRGAPGPFTSSAYYSLQTLYEHHTRTWSSSSADAASHSQ